MSVSVSVSVSVFVSVFVSVSVCIQDAKKFVKVRIARVRVCMGWLWFVGSIKL